MTLRSLSTGAKQKVVEQLTAQAEAASQQREQYVYAPGCADPVVHACLFDAMDGFHGDSSKGDKIWKKPADARQSSGLAKPKSLPGRGKFNADALLKFAARNFEDK